MIQRRLAKLLTAASLLVRLGFTPAVLGQDVATAPVGGIAVAEEPDHQLVFSNSYVNAYAVEIDPQSSTLLHQHRHDNIAVVFGTSNITDVVNGKTPDHMNLADSTVNVSRAPYVHMIRNNDALPCRHIMLELLQGEGDVTNLYSSVNDALAASTADTSGAKQNRVLESDLVRMLAVEVPSHRGWSAPHDGQPRLVVMLDRPAETLESADENTTFADGLLLWSDAANQSKPITNGSPRPLRLVVLEFKQQQQPASEQTAAR
jgi:hypothetical protein